MAYNYRDPRYQRAMLKAGANPTVNPYGASEAITGQFVDQQQGVLSRFQDLAENKRRFNANMGLAKKQSRYQQNAFKRQLDNSKAAMKLGLVGGVGTSLVAGLIGMNNRKKLEAEAGLRSKFLQKQLSAQEKQNKLLENIMKDYN